MRSLSILIVDNNPGVVKQLDSVLTEYDPSHVRRSVDTSDEALVFCRSFHPDLIIYDMPLTGSGDQEAIAQIKELADHPRIIAISLYEHYRLAALKAGADEFVSKTAPRSMLLAALRRQCATVG